MKRGAGRSSSRARARKVSSCSRTTVCSAVSSGRCRSYPAAELEVRRHGGEGDRAAISVATLDERCERHTAPEGLHAEQRDVGRVNTRTEVHAKHAGSGSRRSGRRAARRYRHAPPRMASWPRFEYFASGSTINPLRSLRSFWPISAPNLFPAAGRRSGPCVRRGREPGAPRRGALRPVPRAEGRGGPGDPRTAGAPDHAPRRGQRLRASRDVHVSAGRGAAPGRRVDERLVYHGNPYVRMGAGP